MPVSQKFNHVLSQFLSPRCMRAVTREAVSDDAPTATLAGFEGSAGSAFLVCCRVVPAVLVPVQVVLEWRRP